MTFDEAQLTEENEGEKTTPEEIAQKFLEHLRERPEAVSNTDGTFEYLLYWKININGLSEDQSASYLETIETNLSAQMDKFNCVSFYVPTLTEPTSLTLVNAKTMKYVKM